MSAAREGRWAFPESREGDAKDETLRSPSLAARRARREVLEARWDKAGELWEQRGLVLRFLAEKGELEAEAILGQRRGHGGALRPIAEWPTPPQLARRAELTARRDFRTQNDLPGSPAFLPFGCRGFSLDILDGLADLGIAPEGILDLRIREQVRKIESCLFLDKATLAWNENAKRCARSALYRPYDEDDVKDALVGSWASLFRTMQIRDEDSQGPRSEWIPLDEKQMESLGRFVNRAIRRSAEHRSQITGPPMIEVEVSPGVWGHEPLEISGVFGRQDDDDKGSKQPDPPDSSPPLDEVVIVMEHLTQSMPCVLRTIWKRLADGTINSPGCLDATVAGAAMALATLIRSGAYDGVEFEGLRDHVLDLQRPGWFKPMDGRPPEPENNYHQRWHRYRPCVRTLLAEAMTFCAGDES